MSTAVPGISLLSFHLLPKKVVSVSNIAILLADIIILFV